MQKLPLLERGKYYHIYNRGNNGENIFFEDQNYKHFLSLYEKYIFPIADTYAFSLLRNHFHLFVRIKTNEEIRKDLQGFENLEGLKVPDPTNQFSKLFNAYAKAINKAYGRTGALFEKRFRRKPVTTLKHFLALIHYIHINPQKHGFVKGFREYPYSSYNIVFSDAPTKLDRETVLKWFRNRNYFKEFHDGRVDEKIISNYIEDDIES